MSRPRSGSPRYRRFPWDERDFDPYKVLAELDESPSDVSHHSREDVREHRDYFREDVFPEGQRRSSPFPDDQFGHKHLDQEEFYRRRPSPRHDAMDRLFSPLRDGGSDGERRRGGFKEDLQSFQNRGRSPFSPVRLPREKLPLTPKTHSDHSQRVPGIGWRREEQGRDRGRFRDLDPSGRSDDQRGSGSERGGRNAQSANRGRRREDLRQERSPSLKRQRREMDDSDHLRYRNEESFGEPRYSVGTSRDGLGGDTHGSLSRGDSQHLGPLVVEHDHGIADSREQRRWERLDDRGNRNSDLNRQRSPRPMSSSQQHFRKSSSRSDVREDIRGRPLQDNWRDSKYHEPRRNPLPQDKPNPNRYGNRDGPTHQRGKSGSRPARGKFERHPGGRTGLPQNQPHSDRPSQGYQDLPHEQHRHGYRAQREDSYEDAVKEEPNWAEEDRLQQWESDRPGSLDRLPPRDLDPKMPRQREQGWTDQKPDNTNVVTEETLTIKVDMSRPANQKSPLCYSTDRQLSLDLVNVGRQRLDFLPMLEHSGTFRETATHTGTFAQEIITLVHHVKELYFRGDGVTLSERFSAPQKGSYAEEETEELTLDERFTSNRGFSPNLNSVLDDEQPLFSRLGTLQGFGQQPMRGPGDLRHDLERRRQERLEGVKVTIPGNSLSQRPLGPAGEQSLEYSDMDEKPPMEDEGFCSWPMEQNRRWEGIDRAKRGDSYRSNTGPQRRNNRNRLGPMRRQNNRSNHEGPNW